MRRRAELVLIILFSSMVVSAVVAEPVQAVTVSKAAIQRLNELNEILDEILYGLSDRTIGPEEFDDMLDAAMASFEAVLSEMPVAGLPFSNVFTALYDIKHGLSAAGEIFLWQDFDTYSLQLAISDVRRVKDSLEWQASGGLIQKQLECERGKALVMVYPGFDCHALRAKLNELLAACVCVTVGWQESVCYIPDPDVAYGGPTAMRLFECLGISYTVGPKFELDSLIEPGAYGFSEYHTFGDPSEDCYVPETPTSPHATYVDSTLALEVTGGEPTRYDPNQAFLIDDVVKPWYKVQDVCDPLAVGWFVYDSTGILTYTNSSTLDPKEFNTDCLSNYSSSGWMSLDAGSFGIPGTYTAELWLGGQHCASHPFQMAGPGNRLPYVNNDLYMMDEDFVLEVEDSPVTTNDFDPDLDPLTTSLDEGPRHGSLTLNSDGTFTYTPGPDYYGVDWYTYTATDPGGLWAAGEVTIVVNSMNDPPTATDDAFDLLISPEDNTWKLTMPNLGWTETGPLGDDGMSLTIPAPGVLINDQDPDNDPLTLLFAGPLPPMMRFFPDGSLTIPVDVPDLPKTYQVTYTAADPSGLEATGEVEIQVRLQEDGE